MTVSHRLWNSLRACNYVVNSLHTFTPHTHTHMPILISRHLSHVVVIARGEHEDGAG